MSDSHQAADLERLVARARNGDEGAFRALFDATYRELRLFLGARARSRELVDEILQTTYVAAFESLDRYTAGSFIAWLKGIARNSLHREVERRSRNAPVDLLAEQPGLAPAVDDLAPRLERCLERLTASARQLIDMRYHQRVQVQEIASQLGRTASSVSVSLFRVRKALAECLGPEVMDHV